MAHAVGAEEKRGGEAMSNSELPLVVSAPEPRTLELIFTPGQLAKFRSRYRVVETTGEGLSSLPPQVLAEARYIVGQPPISPGRWSGSALRCIFNVETNLIEQHAYSTLFQRGIHVVTPVGLRRAVAELGRPWRLIWRAASSTPPRLREGRELWGGDGKPRARCCRARKSGIVGFGDLGPLLTACFPVPHPHPRLRPRLPPSCWVDTASTGTLDEVLSRSDFASWGFGDLGEPGLPRWELSRRCQGAPSSFCRWPACRFRCLDAAVESGTSAPPASVPARTAGEGPPVRKLPTSSARRTGPGRWTWPSSAWATWCWKTWPDGPGLPRCGPSGPSARRLAHRSRPVDRN